jgi:hypothetical protein
VSRAGGKTEGVRSVKGRGRFANNMDGYMDGWEKRTKGGAWWGVAGG